MMAMERRTAIHIFPASVHGQPPFWIAVTLFCPVFSADYTLYDLTDSSQFSHKVNTNFFLYSEHKKKTEISKEGIFHGRYEYAVKQHESE